LYRDIYCQGMEKTNALVKVVLRASILSSQKDFLFSQTLLARLGLYILYVSYAKTYVHVILGWITTESH